MRGGCARGVGVRAEFKYSKFLFGIGNVFDDAPKGES